MESNLFSGTLPQTYSVPQKITALGFLLLFLIGLIYSTSLLFQASPMEPTPSGFMWQEILMALSLAVSTFMIFVGMAWSLLVKILFLRKKYLNTEL